MDPGNRGTRPVTDHDDDFYSKESVFVAAIVAGSARKSGKGETVGGVTQRAAIDVIDVCLLRESATSPMREYFEYSDEWCEMCVADCGTGVQCYKRHKEPIPLESLRPPPCFELVDNSPRARRGAAVEGACVPGHRPDKAKIWPVPSGAWQEAQLAIAKDRLDGVIAE